MTNEYATMNPDEPDAVRSDVWEMTSGSLFVRDGVAWSGQPQTGAIDARSESGTNSGVFRLTTRRHDFGDVSLRLRLRVLAQSPPDDSDPQVDGVHLWVRHVDEAELYVVSVMRRDGLVVIKRKLPGGPTNGGRYTTLGETRRPLTIGEWHDVEARAWTSDAGTVHLTALVDGRSVLSVEDTGQPPEGGGDGRTVSGPGAVGIRGDRTEFEFSDLVVTSCRSDAVDDCR